MRNGGGENSWSCPLVMGHLEIQPDGDVFACCASGTAVPFGNLHKDSLEEIFDGQSRREFVTNFQQGKGFLNPHCHYCKLNEEKSLPSPRVEESDRWTRKGLKDTYSEPFGKIVSLGIRFSNLCNFACRTCKPSASTAWIKDAKFLNPSGNYKKIIAAPKSSPLVDQVVPLLKAGLERIYFAGGEPLLEVEHYELLELIVKDYPKLALEYDTNLSILNLGKKNVLELWEKCENLYISVSLDGFGRKGEYIRSGLDWDELLKNLEAVKESCPKAKIGTNFVLNNYNVIHVLEYLQFLREEDSPLLNAEVNFTICEEPTWLAPSQLPRKIKDQISQLYEAYLSDENSTHKVGIKRYLDYLREPAKNPNPTFKLFRRHTKALDILRSQSFEETFPELSTIFGQMEIDD